MDTQLIGLWIGLSITFLLGVFNLLWGPAILERRDKVIIANPKIFADYLPSEKQLEFEIDCTLALRKGKGIEIQGVEVRLNNKIYRALEKYFRLPRSNRFSLYTTLFSDLSDREDSHAILKPKQATHFHRIVTLDCTEEFEKNYGVTKNDPRADIQPLLDEMETKYTICWTSYDGKEICWRFPNEWWRNLGKKLWG